jgi:hypothetical protein
MTRTNLERRSTDTLMAKLVSYLGELKARFSRATRCASPRCCAGAWRAPPREVREGLMVLSRAPARDDVIARPCSSIASGTAWRNSRKAARRLLAAQMELRL